VSTREVATAGGIATVTDWAAKTRSARRADSVQPSAVVESDDDPVEPSLAFVLPISLSPEDVPVVPVLDDDSLARVSVVLEPDDDPPPSVACSLVVLSSDAVPEDVSLPSPVSFPSPSVTGHPSNSRDANMSLLELLIARSP